MLIDLDLEQILGDLDRSELKSIMEIMMNLVNIMNCKGQNLRVLFEMNRSRIVTCIVVKARTLPGEILAQP